MRLYSAAILAVLMASVTSVFSASVTLDPLWASGMRGPDPSLITPQCVDGGDCNMCKFFDWLVNRQNCNTNDLFLHITYCKRIDDYFNSLSALGQQYATAIKACQIKALIPYYGNSAGTCTKINTTAALSWFGSGLSCLYQAGLLCDVIKNDADLEVIWLILEEYATPASEAIITTIRDLAKKKCDASVSNNLEQFVEDKLNAPDPWTARPPAQTSDPWTQAPGNPDPWPTTKKPNRRPNKNKPNKNKPNRNRPNKNRPNKNRPNKNRPNKRPNNNKNNGNNNRNPPPPSNYNLHYWK